MNLFPALEEEGLILPNLNASLTSSLLGVQDMVSILLMIPIC